MDNDDLRIKKAFVVSRDELALFAPDRLYLPSRVNWHPLKRR